MFVDLHTPIRVLQVDAPQRVASSEMLHEVRQALYLERKPHEVLIEDAGVVNEAEFAWSAGLGLDDERHRHVRSLAATADRRHGVLPA